MTSLSVRPALAHKPTSVVPEPDDSAVLYLIVNDDTEDDETAKLIDSLKIVRRILELELDVPPPEAERRGVICHDNVDEPVPEPVADTDRPLNDTTDEEPVPGPDAETTAVLILSDVEEPVPEPSAVRGIVRKDDADDEPVPLPVAVSRCETPPTAEDDPVPEADTVRSTTRKPDALAVPVPPPVAATTTA